MNPSALKKSLFIFLLFFTRQIISSENPLITYQYASEQLNTLSKDPFTFLKDLSKSLKIMELSSQEKIYLVDKLQALKHNLCNRSRSSILLLPLFATFICGVKSWLDYEEVKFSRSSNLLFLSSVHESNVNTCMASLCLFIFSIVCTIVLELEHQERVSSLFEKERTLEKKIDALIAALQK